jgi:demethylmenaquinone methyltransferase/2-methoxy-6-polyprenyl-1,4-benzoquinol methylase
VSDDGLLESQIAYYRAHAPRYDDWWFREGRHDLGDAYRDSWNAQIQTLLAALTDLAPLGDVLELAGGTGNWTRELAMLADSVTVVDASPEAVAIARAKVVGNVSWLPDNIFSFRPAQHYDTVFFGFWLSHVPLERFQSFWQLVRDCLEVDGRVFFIDNADPRLARAVAPEQFGAGRWDVDETRVKGIDSVTDLKTGVATRTAADGRSYDLVKVWWEPSELQSRLAALGWKVEVRTTEWAFIYGFGSPADRTST